VHHDRTTTVIKVIDEEMILDLKDMAGISTKRAEALLKEYNGNIVSLVLIPAVCATPSVLQV
jgi:hypothetical protein